MLEATETEEHEKVADGNLRALPAAAWRSSYARFEAPTSQNCNLKKSLHTMLQETTYKHTRSYNITTRSVGFNKYATSHRLAVGIDDGTLCKAPVSVDSKGGRGFSPLGCHLLVNS